MRFHIQELFIDYQSDNEARAIFYFIITDGQTFESSAVSVFQKFWGKLS